ncbi:PAQR family membrane homeostasis protein TrhA [Marinicella meishanensis]|uniref:PAQR family membrane homeostasis protein TrhA n=1 Tax=Marinicella meishanensis TaxID=2873263 RepID=UPI001CBEFC20|nr:hemolysin III family protein [Marinicella sp. NBU2979]
MTANPVKYYPPLEEKVNIGSHLLGLLLSVVGLVLLLIEAIQAGSTAQVVGFTVFGVSLMLLYTASAVYHASQKPALRRKLRVLDHAAIYLLIAGTYTPFMLVTLPGTLGYGILIAAWSMALVGIVLKVFFTGRFELGSTLLYVLMGWAIVFAIKPLAANLPATGLSWLIAGGIAYTLGAVLYAIKKIPFNHAIFHVFVLLGSGCHFVAVYGYVGV